jgi:hypothetical protein
VHRSCNSSIRQIKPCRFKKTDRRRGPGARGRDRVIGFPGVSPGLARLRIISGNTSSFWS